MIFGKITHAGAELSRSGSGPFPAILQIGVCAGTRHPINGLPDQLRIPDGTGIHADLVGSREQHRPDRTDERALLREPHGGSGLAQCRTRVGMGGVFDYRARLRDLIQPQHASEALLGHHIHFPAQQCLQGVQ